MTRRQTKSNTRIFTIFQFCETLKTSPRTTKFKNTNENDPYPVNSWPIKEIVRPKKNPVINLNEICKKDCAEDFAFACAPCAIDDTCSVIPTLSS